MDNAKYHRTLEIIVLALLKSRNKKLSKNLEELGLEVPNDAKKPELSDTLCKWADENMSMEIEKLAKEAGLLILWSAPCFSDLNPVEMLWSSVKRRVGDKYSKSTESRYVEDRLQRLFVNLYLLEAEKHSPIWSIILTSSY